MDRKIHVPVREWEDKRNDIHTALLSSQGAEMVFATSVLLVEGEGDRAFFEGLRCRLAKRDKSGRIDNLFIIQVGGKTGFGPWIKLLYALNGRGISGPFSYLVVPDGDATTEVHQALVDSNISIPRNALLKLQDAREEFSRNDYDAWRVNLDKANEFLFKSDSPLCFLANDLEWAIFSDLSSSDCARIAFELGVVFENREAFIKKMGSKGVNGEGGKQCKAPYLRKQIAEMVELADISQNIKLVLKRWLINAGFTPRDAETHVR